MDSGNARLGLRLFLLYTLFYAAFVLVNTFAPAWMESRPAAGVNAAILSGCGLIVLALLMALAYGVLCTREEEPKGEGRP